MLPVRDHRARTSLRASSSAFGGFPGRDLADDVSLMVVSGRIEGTNKGDWLHEVNAFFADQPYHPPLSTPKPRTFGVESATVVGPEDDEIHTDEFRAACAFNFIGTETVRATNARHVGSP